MGANSSTLCGEGRVTGSLWQSASRRRRRLPAIAEKFGDRLAGRHELGQERACGAGPGSSAIICLVGKVLSYFGLDGSATRKDWAHAAVEALPPMILAAVAAGLDGVDGVVGWGLGVLFLVVASVVWWSLILRFAPWRRA